MTSEKARSDPPWNIGTPKLKNSSASHHILLSGNAAHVTHRPVKSNTEASLLGLAPNGTHPVASQISMEDPRVTRKGDPDPKISPSILKVVAPRGKSPARPLHPLSHSLQMP